MNQQPMSPAPVPSGVEGPQGGSSTMKWLLIILVIVIVLGGGYWVYAKYGKTLSNTATNTSPSAFSTANWKTYTNDTYGYKFSYPPEWIFLSQSDPTKILLATPESEQSISILINNLTVDQYIAEIKRDGLNNKVSRSKVTFAGEPSTKLKTEMTTSSTKKQAYFLEVNGKNYLIDCTIFPNNKSLTFDLENQIVSTFQFTP